MRAGMSTIQQTLTSEAAAVLNCSISEAARRSHGQTTPLHVAATLLAAPSGLLRQACIRSHPNSSHPLQCRALELCFSVALDRLPAVNPANNTNGSNSPASASASASAVAAAEPPISNALMAALKRAQAHQRRGCPEQQQQPLLAVKVELEQLVVSILDDPSVSRVMREASFSSPAVKATIEQSLSSSPSSSSNPSPSTSIAAAAAGVGVLSPPISRNLYMNPRLHQQRVSGGDPVRKDEAQRVLDIMMRSKKRNPIIVTDSDPVGVIRDVLQKIEAGDAPPPLRAAHVIQLEKEFASVSPRSRIPAKIKELSSSIEARIGDGSGRGVVLDLGDLKWLVEIQGSIPQQKQQQIVSDTSRAAVVEMARVLQGFADSSSSKVWLLGTATCATYLRCQVYHPAMDNDWDLQAVPSAPRSTLPISFPRLGGNGILSSSVESLAPMKGFPAMNTAAASLWRSSESTDSPSSRKTTLCAICMEKYERELATLVAKEFDKSSSYSKPEPRQALPHWMQKHVSTTKSSPDQVQSKAQEIVWKQSTEELLKRWQETCSRIHYFPNPSIFPPQIKFSQSISLTNNHHTRLLQTSEWRARSPPGSPVKTDLVLGRPKPSVVTLENSHRDRVNDSTGCTQNGFSHTDSDSFKRLFKGLTEKVEWQSEAAATVATVVMNCKSGKGKPRGAGAKGDMWLMFIGPDKVGKRKMAVAVSELVFGNTSPVTVNLGGSVPVCDRGRTSVDRIADAIRRNPFSVVVLEEIDRADTIVRGRIKHAIERGRLLDSRGRDVSLGSVIFVLTADSLPESEERILSLANCGWQLELTVGDRAGKRRSECVSNNDRPAKLRKELSLDLNLAVGLDDDTGEGSRNSSDLTVEYDQENVRLAISCAVVSPTTEMMGLVDGSVEFKPVDFGPTRRKVLESIHAKFRVAKGDGRLIRVEEDALDRMVGGVWIAEDSTSDGFEDWVDGVLVHTINQLNSTLVSRDGNNTVRLSVVKGVRRQGTGIWPATVAIAGDGALRCDV